MRYYKTTAYIVDADAMTEDMMRGLAYEATPIPADITKRMVYIHWESVNDEERFEATPGVMTLGFPWEVPPVDAIPLIQSLYQADTDLLASRGLALPSVDDPPESLASMLRKVSQQARRIA